MCLPGGGQRIASLPLQAHRLPGPPRLGHQLLAAAQGNGVANSQHMVGRITAAGDPGLAGVHTQPAGLAGLQRQHGIDAQLAVGCTQHLQGAGGDQTGHGGLRWMRRRPQGEYRDHRHHAVHGPMQISRCIDEPEA